MAEIKYDIRRGVEVYRTITESRLNKWILTGKIKRGEVLVWRDGLSGWRRAEELEELVPFFNRWEKLQLGRIKREESLREQILPQNKRIKNILIIDDEKDLCSLLYDILRQRKYDVSTANTEREALSYIKRKIPDLVFLDLRLPDGDGIKLISRIKKVNPESMVNIISAYGDEEAREKAKNEGASTFIDKPFTEKEILRSIEKLNKPR